MSSEERGSEKRAPATRREIIPDAETFFLNGTIFNWMKDISVAFQLGLAYTFDS